MPTVNLLKLPDPAARTAKYVNMMNATKQQETAERQAAMAQEKLDLDKKEGERQEKTLESNTRKADLDYKLETAKRLRNLGVTVYRTKDPARREAAYQSWLGLVDKADKEAASLIRQASDTYDADIMLSLLMETDKFIDKTVTTPTDELVFGPDDKLYVAGKGGLSEGLRPLINKPAVGSPTVPPAGTTPAPRTPVVPTAAPQQPEMSPSPIAVGKYGETLVAPDGGPLTPDLQESLRTMKEGLGMTNTPASFNSGGMGAPTAGQMSPDMVPAILDSAVKTGVMAQIDLDQMLAMTPPQARDGIMQVIRDSKIALQADAPSLVTSAMNQQQPMAPNPVGRQQSTYANLPSQPMPISNADLGGQPQMQNTMARTNVAGQQAYGRSASPTSPVPGIYGVPTQDVAATSRATRPSKQEMYDAEAAKIQAARDAGPPPVTAQQKIARKSEVAQAYSKTQTLIDKAYNPKEGIISIANKIKSLSPDQKEAITGYSGYVPSFRESSREADTLFGNLKGVVTSLGKDAAAASGAVGNMAVQEWKIAADMIANLDLANMTPAALNAQMDRIIEQVSNATKLAERVYNIQYGDDVKQYPDFKLRGTPPARTKTPVVKGGTMISPDIDKILKSRGI